MLVGMERLGSIAARMAARLKTSRDQHSFEIHQVPPAPAGARARPTAPPHAAAGLASPRIEILSWHTARDTGTTVALSLFLEVDGRGLDVILREAIPVDAADPRQASRVALARAALALRKLAALGIE